MSQAQSGPYHLFFHFNHCHWTPYNLPPFDGPGDQRFRVGCALSFFLNWVDLRFLLRWWLSIFLGSFLYWDLSYFAIGKLIPSVSVQVVLVGGIRCMMLSTCDLGVHVWLSPPEYFPVGWVLLSLGWVHAYVFCLGSDSTGWYIQYCSTTLIWWRVYELTAVA